MFLFGMTKSGRRKLVEASNKNIPTVSWWLEKSLATPLGCIKIIQLREINNGINSQPQLVQDDGNVIRP